MAIVLASGSPRRKELLSLIVPDFSVIVSQAEENADKSLATDKYVEELAKIKAKGVLNLTAANDTVIAADTVVFINGSILGKPHTKDEARQMLLLLSGKKHTVYTGVYIAKGNNSICFCDKTEVEFYDLSEKDIENYILTGEPFDKAGGYGIQGQGAVLVKGITGDYYNVMGFPVAKVYRALKAINSI